MRFKEMRCNAGRHYGWGPEAIWAILILSLPLLAVCQTPLTLGPGCRIDTVEHVIVQNRVDLGKDSAKLLGSGILLFAARNGPPIIKWGTALLMLPDLPSFAKTVSDSIQLQSMPGKTPGTEVKICPIDDATARAFNFQHMQVILPPSTPSTAPKISPSSPKPPGPRLSIDDWLTQNKPILFPDSPQATILHPFARAKPGTPPITPDAAPETFGLNLGPAPTGSVTGTVVDKKTGSRVNNAWIRLTTAHGGAIGSWRETRTWDESKFEFEVPGDAYLLSVESRGYRPYRTSVQITPGKATSLSVAVQQASPDYCDVTILNKTGWRITLEFDDPGPPLRLAPWANIAIPLKGPVRMKPFAYFDNGGPPLRWGDYQLHCNGPGYLVLDDSYQ